MESSTPPVASTSAANPPVIHPDLFERNPPIIQPDQHHQPPPNHKALVQIFHPVVLKPFLILTAYDYDPSGNIWGVHYGTVNTACWTLVGNRRGYLTSYDRETTFDKQPDDILPAGRYIYFLDGFPLTKNYAICKNFRSWPFPDTVPIAWDTVPSVEPLVGSVTSSMVRGRDKCCTISGEKFSLTSARVVPFAERFWVDDNFLGLQLGGPSFDKDPTNYITLTAGVHSPQFDEGVWVPVPKCGQYRIHFLLPDPVLAVRYHNNAFGGSHVTSGRLLLSRFVWSNCRNLQKFHFRSLFRSFHGNDDGDDDDDDDDGGDGDGGEGHDDSDRKGKGKETRTGKGKRKRKCGGRSTRKRKKGDDDKDCRPPRASRIRTKASYKKVSEMTLDDEELLSLNDPYNLAASADLKPSSEEYPGQADVERIKAEYIKANPQIQQHSDQVLISNFFHESMWDSE